MEVVRADAFAMSEVNVSSSMVRACLAEGEVGMAARCLTRPYEITGRVVHGFHVGHEPVSYTHLLVGYCSILLF